MESLYIGVDLHSRTFQACAVRVDGTRAWEAGYPRSEAGVAAFVARCGRGARVAVEASTPTWHFVDAVVGHVEAVVIVDARRTRLKAGYAAKTDRLDARRLADAYRRDSVTTIYYPPRAIRELRERCRHRHTLVRTRTMLIQRLRATLLRQGIVEAKRLVTARGDARLEAWRLDGAAGETVHSLQQVLQAVRGELGPVNAWLQRAAAADPIVQALIAIPGVGPVIGLTLRAEIGDIARFATPAQLASYAGLVPRVEASAGRAYYGRITKRGSPWLRWVLIEAAMHGPRRPDAPGRWARRLAVRKGALKARVAVARRLCTEVWEVWRSSK
jgi:transposase